MRLTFNTAVDEHCAGCGGRLDMQIGGERAIVDNKSYHVACTPKRDTSQRMTLVAIAVIQGEWAAGVISAQEAMLAISNAIDRSQ